MRVAFVGQELADELLIAGVAAGHAPVPVIEASAVVMAVEDPDRDALTSGPLPVMCVWRSHLDRMSMVWTWDPRRGPSDEYQVHEPDTAMLEWLDGLPEDVLDEQIPPD